MCQLSDHTQSNRLSVYFRQLITFIAILALVGCGSTEVEPDIDATVAAGIAATVAAQPTDTPIPPPTPDMEATISAGIAATQEAMEAEAPTDVPPTDVPPTEPPAEEPTDVPAEPTEPPTAVPTEEPAATEPPAPTEEPAAEASAIDSELLLDAKWYIDSNLNLAPDFIEVEYGFDPLIDQCAAVANCTSDFADPTQDTNLVFVLDVSGSMAATTSTGTNRMEAAKRIIEEYMGLFPDSVDAGLVLFGHKGDGTDAGKPASCAEAEMIEPIGGLTLNNVASTLEPIQPVGWTPIGVALQEAAKMFEPDRFRQNRIILISDGLESCNGNPVGEAEALFNGALNVVVDVVAISQGGSSDVFGLQDISDAGGGTYMEAESADRIIRNWINELEAVIFDRRSYQSCININMFDIANCNAELYNFSQSIISDERNNYDFGSPEYTALRDLRILMDERKVELSMAALGVSDEEAEQEGPLAELEARVEELKAKLDQ